VKDDFAGAADILEAAAGLLEAVGHCKHASCEVDADENVTAYCALGSVNVAALEICGLGFWNVWLPLRIVFDSVKVELWGNPLLDDMEIADWNDDPEREPSDVIDLFKQVAKDLRNVQKQPE
jgi:hypothetical protein